MRQIYKHKNNKNATTQPYLIGKETESIDNDKAMQWKIKCGRGIC